MSACLPTTIPSQPDWSECQNPSTRNLPRHRVTSWLPPTCAWPERSMPFDWKTFIELAQFLQEQAETTANPEALLRTALSRAYYGTFCYVRNHARDRLGFHPRDDGDDHGRLRAYLKNGKMRGVSDKLQRLREWRNECDYR